MTDLATEPPQVDPPPGTPGTPGDGPKPPAPKRKRRFRGTATSFYAAGEPARWLAGGGLALCLVMIVALVLNADFRGRGLVRAAILIPWAIPTIVSAKMWAWMLNDQFGILNDLGLRLGLLSQKVAWTASADTAMQAVLLVDIWKTTPFMALLILAGLQMIPKDIYEAAELDGVHPVKQFFAITLPLVRPALMVAIIFRLLDALRIFDLIYVLTPNSSATKTMSVLARENLFDFDKFAYGSAQSTLLFLIIAVLTVLYIWLGKVRFDGGDR